jgi:hypothetical protein
MLCIVFSVLNRVPVLEGVSRPYLYIYRPAVGGSLGTSFALAYVRSPSACRSSQSGSLQVSLGLIELSP